MKEWPDGEAAIQAGSPAEDLDLLSAILRRNLPARSSRRLADRLIRHFGNLRAVLRAEQAVLLHVHGCEEACAAESARTWRLQERLASALLAGLPLLDRPEAAQQFCRTMLSGEKREKLHVLFLDRGWRLTGRRCLQTGTIDHVTVYPREVLEAALRAGAFGIILCHNHPAGTARPSRGDVSMTRRIVAAAEMLGVRVCDHIIVGDTATFSFRQAGLLQLDTVPSLTEDYLPIRNDLPAKMRSACGAGTAIRPGLRHRRPRRTECGVSPCST